MKNKQTTDDLTVPVNPATEAKEKPTIADLYIPNPAVEAQRGLKDERVYGLFMDGYIIRLEVEYIKQGGTQVRGVSLTKLEHSGNMYMTKDREHVRKELQLLKDFDASIGKRARVATFMRSPLLLAYIEDK